MKAAKVTFYPQAEAAQGFENAPAKKVSERINELILKGLAKEKEEKLQRDYEQYDRELASARLTAVDARGRSSTILMSARLFTEDEGSNDEDLI